MTARQAQWLNASINDRIFLAEVLGEEGASAYAIQKGYEPILTTVDRSLPQGIDQVYRTKDGLVLAIEAKGGTSPIARAYGCVQGTPEWAVQAAKRTVLSPKASSAEKQAAKLVLEAARDGKLAAEVIRTRHILGEPMVVALESSLKASQAESKAAAAILEEIAVLAKGGQVASRIVEVAKRANESLSGASSLKAGQAEANATSAILVESAAIARGSSKTIAAVGAISKVVKVAGVAGVALDGAVRVTSAIDTEKQYQSGEISTEQRVTTHAQNAVGMTCGLGGAWAGAKGGAATGGLVGACFGGVGAPIGATIGGGVGAVGGYLGGDYLGKKLVNGVKWLWK